MKKITVIPNQYKDKDMKCLIAICDFLRGRGVSFAVPVSYKKYVKGMDIALTDEPFDSELAVVIGGDGSILHSAVPAAFADVPLVGINLGKVGYMASIEPDDLDGLGRVLEGKYFIEERTMLKITTDSGTYYALNDAVVSNGKGSRMVDIELDCNGLHVSRYFADGIIIASPTGSTAYSLSAGGPVIDPVLDCICATPICPHSLTARPLVFSGSSVLCVSTCIPGRSLCLSVDGGEYIELGADEAVQIVKAEQKLKLVKIEEQSFCALLNNKL